MRFIPTIWADELLYSLRQHSEAANALLVKEWQEHERRMRDDPAYRLAQEELDRQCLFQEEAEE